MEMKIKVSTQTAEIIKNIWKIQFLNFDGTK